MGKADECEVPVPQCRAFGVLAGVGGAELAAGLLRTTPNSPGGTLGTSSHRFEATEL